MRRVGLLTLALVGTLLAGCAGSKGRHAAEIGMQPELNPEQELDAAIIAADKRVADDPSNAANHVLLGNAYLNRSWPFHAEEAYKASLELAPEDAVAMNNLGLVALRLGDSDEAADAFKKALEIDPLFAEAHYNLATTYEAKKDFRQAMDHYKIALISEPSLADPAVNPNARASKLLAAAQLSLYLDITGALALRPVTPKAPAQSP